MERGARHYGPVLGAILVLVLVVLLTRFPFFFNPIIDWDESTFTLLGQSILDGHVPYVDYWEVKPPLTFATFSVFIAVFGKSIVAIRIGGALCLLLAAFACYRIGEVSWPKRNVGLVAGLLVIGGVAVTPSGQSTMTEIIAIAPLCLALLVMVRAPSTWRSIGLAGVLIAVASMVRLNLLYVSVTVALVLLVLALRQGEWRRMVREQLAFGIGHIVVFLAVALPFVVAGSGWALLEGAVLAPLSYAGSSLSPVDAGLMHVSGILARIGSFDFLTAFIWGAAIAGVVMTAISWRQWPPVRQRVAGMTLVFAGGVALSMVQGGAAYPHYLMQLIPFLALLAAVFLGSFMEEGRRRTGLSALVVVIVLAGSVTWNLGAYRTMAAQIYAGQSLARSSALYEVADYLKRNRTGDAPIYMMTEHILHWFIGSAPLSKCTNHPSNISRRVLRPFCGEPGEGPQGEMKRILALEPEYIVKRRGMPWYLDDAKGAWRVLNQALEQDYELETVIHRREIYRRKAG